MYLWFPVENLFANKTETQTEVIGVKILLWICMKHYIIAYFWIQCIFDYFCFEWAYSAILLEILLKMLFPYFYLILNSCFRIQAIDWTNNLHFYFGIQTFQKRDKKLKKYHVVVVGVSTFLFATDTYTLIAHGFWNRSCLVRFKLWSVYLPKIKPNLCNFYGVFYQFLKIWILIFK